MSVTTPGSIHEGGKLGYVLSHAFGAAYDMVVLNAMSRYHICIEAMRRVPRVHELVPPLIAECDDVLSRHRSYVRANLEDMPEVRDWVWTD